MIKEEFEIEYKNNGYLFLRFEEREKEREN